MIKRIIDEDISFLLMNLKIEALALQMTLEFASCSHDHREVGAGECTGAEGADLENPDRICVALTIERQRGAVNVTAASLQ
jgi:hypothetical protein